MHRVSGLVMVIGGQGHLLIAVEDLEGLGDGGAVDDARGVDEGRVPRPWETHLVRQFANHNGSKVHSSAPWPCVP